MTERVEKIEVEKRIFVANDGAEFQTAQDCMQYERDCIETVSYTHLTLPTTVTV